MQKENLQPKEKELKQKIADYVKEKTPKKAKYATGLSWTAWLDFFLTAEEAETFIGSQTIQRFFVSTCGTQHHYQAMVYELLVLYPRLASLILCSDRTSHLFKYKSHVISSGSYLKEAIDLEVVSSDPDAAVSWLKLSTADEAKRFLTNSNEKVRLEAYNRIGYLSCADLMIKDKSAKVREAIATALPAHSELLLNLVDDRSKWVFWNVLKKIETKKLPLLMGSRHLKDKFINDTLKRRLNK